MHEDSFLDLVRLHERGVRGTIAGMGLPPDVVDDVAQETFLAVHRQRDRLPPQDEHRPWIRGIARNQARMWLRTRLRQRQLLERYARLMNPEATTPAAPDPSPGPINPCLDRLDPEARRLIERRYIDGEDATAIAAGTGRSPAGVRMALLRVRQLLRECLDSQTEHA
jgi:RNA polymerase sigma factor (sigma-70 family)